MNAARSAAVAVAFGLGCGSRMPTSGPSRVEIPVADGAEHGRRSGNDSGRQSAPPSGTPKDAPFPPVSRFTIPNGLSVAIASSHGWPIVHVRLLIPAGWGHAPSPPLARLTADLLKDGGTRTMAAAEVVRRVETLGTRISVRTDFDATVLSMPATKDDLAECLALLAQVLREPRFEDEALRKLKVRATDAAVEVGRAGGPRAAMHVVFRELFPEKSPYAAYLSLPSQIAKVDVAAVREFYRRFYVPKGATLVLAGDVAEGDAKALAERHFGAWAGAPPPGMDPPAPRPVTKTRVFVVHRPRSSRSDVYVATSVPPRKSEAWPALRVATQILGGDRLVADLRERGLLAMTTSAEIVELARGEQLLAMVASVEGVKGAEAARVLHESLARLTTLSPTAAEMAAAGGGLSDALALQLEPTGSIADLVVKQDEFGLPDGYWGAYRKQLRATDASQVEAAANKLHAMDKALVVVAGDADLLAPELLKLGDVTVVDPEKEFKTMRTLPQVTK